MRIPASALFLLVAAACAHSQAPASDAPAPSSSAAAVLPHMEPPASPPVGWKLVKRADRLARQQKSAEALALYTEAWDAGNGEPNTAYSAACAAALLGRKQEALTWLSRAAEHGFRDVKWMKQDGDLVSLRQEPAFTALAERIPGMPDRFPGSNEELKHLFEEDQADRSPPPSGPEGWKGVSARDEQRRERVKELLAAGALKTGADFLAAAFIFQHGREQADFAQARELGAEAARRGHPGGLWIAAAAWDRWLMNAGQPQRFGTQYKFSPESKTPRLYTVDTTVTDAERERWGFPPLAEIPGAM